MRFTVTIASASAILLAGFLSPAAHAADPPVTDLASSVSASGPNGSLGVAVKPKDNTLGNQRTLVGVPLPISAPPSVGLFPSVGKTLLDNGIDFHGIVFDNFLANPSAGTIPGNTSNFGVAGFTVDLDLGRIIGWQGSFIHAAETIYYAKSNLPEMLTNAGGLLNGNQATGQSTPNELTLLTFEQRFLDDKLEVEVGKTSPYRYFFIPNGLDPLQDISLTVYTDGDMAAIGHSVWGGRATYHLTPQWYVQGGAFEDNFRRSILNSYNFGDREASGAQIVAEIAERSEFNTARYPSNFELGVEYNTRTGYSNIKGAPLDATPRTTAANYPGGGIIYVQGLKVIWRGASKPHAPPKHIAIYGWADGAVDKPQPIDLDAAAGVQFEGFLPGRPFDALQLQVQYQRLSQVEANFETFGETLLGGPGRRQPRDGYVFEVVGNIQVTPWAALRPIVQYDVNPDAYYDAFQRQRPHDGVLAGVFGIISLGPLLGTSKKPF